MTGPFRAVLFSEGDAWVAHCVEVDVCAQGPSVAEARRRLDQTLRAECDYAASLGKAPFAGIEPAPRQIAAMFEKAEGHYAPTEDGGTLVTKLAA